MPTTLMPSAAPIAFDEALVRKYDGFGPRYTSYPTADRFHDRFTAAHYVDALAARNVSGAAVAVRAPAVLQHGLLLLRVQQGHHQEPRPLREVHPLRREGDRHRRRAGRRLAAGDPAALGRRHADVPVARRDGRADGRAAPAVPVRAGRGDLDRGRSRARSTPRRIALPGRTRLQPHLGRHPGFRSRPCRRRSTASRAKPRRAPSSTLRAPTDSCRSTPT